MIVNIYEFKRKLEEYIDPYEIPGAMQAFIEAAEGLESYEIWKEKHKDETDMATEEGLR
mgnify:CR=1 FL=1